MKRSLLSVALFLLGVLLFLGGLYMGRSQRLLEAARSQAAETHSLPEGEELPFSSSLPLIPGTRSEMLSPAFWTQGEDKLLFDAEEIAAFNENNPLFVRYTDARDGLPRDLFLFDMPKRLAGEALLALIEQTSPPAPEAEEERYVNGLPAVPGYWETLYAARNLETIPEKVEPRFAVCVRRTQAMLLPTSDFAASSAEERFCNDLVSGELLPFTGAVLLHESADGCWGFAVCGSFCGWIPMEDLSLCSSRDSWLKALRPSSFLVVTGCEILLDETSAPSLTAGMVLPMGTKLPLLAERPQQIDGRAGLGCWAVRLPCRAEDGTLTWEQALIPVSKDLHEGYLSMSSHSVIRQGFQFLGKIYGWGGSLGSNDCSGMIRQIYSCYGLELPRSALAIAKLQDLGCINCEDMSVSRKLELLSQIPAGQLLYMDGHIMLYLGMDDSKPYVLSSCASYLEPAGGSRKLQDGYCVFVSGLDLLRANGNTWLEDLSYFHWKYY